MPAQWYNNEWYRTRNFQGLWLVARLPAAANDRAVEAGLTQLLRLPPVEGPPADSLETAELGSIILARGPWTADHDTAIALRLSGVAVIVLLIACANVTNLLLARATRRRREVAVRLALGMSRARLAAMLITEAALLALVAGAVASLAALWGGLLLRALLMPNTHFAAPVFDWRVGVATAAAALIAGIGTGALPARQAGQGDLTLALKAGARSGVLQRSRVRPALLMAQAALSVVLLLAAGALLRSMHNVETLRLGFDVDHIVFAELHEKRPEVLRGVVPDVAQRLTTIDNVESVASASMAPMRGFAATMIFLPGRDSLIFGVQPVFNAVSPEFFATTGMRLLRGRGFEKGAGRSGAAEVVISQELAHTLWPGLDPIGRCMQFGARTNPCYTVVGVVENARHWDLTEEPWPEYYLPINRMPVDGYKPSVLIIRTSPNHAASVAAEARRLLHTAFPDNAPTVTAMKEILAPQFHPWRLGATLFSAFGILALCIAAIGVYSTLSYTISQRNHEIGVRVALGAQPRDVARLVFSNALTIVTVGIALGIVLALGLERLIAALLYGTSAHDPLTIGAMAAVLIGAATVAAALPARRASRVDPVIALRTDG
jgi:predicted permease